MTPRFSLQASTSVGDILRVIRFTGEEEMSSLYQFRVELAAPRGAAVLTELLGAEAVLCLRHGTNSERKIHGVINRIEHRSTGRRFDIFQVTVVPAVWRLQLRRDCRIFQDLSVSEIVSEVLGSAGIAADRFRFELSNPLAAREYCVQYRESDWGFVSRLLEHEGIFHFFDHDGDHEVLVLSDSAAAHRAAALEEPVPFVSAIGLAQDAEHISSFRSVAETCVGHAALRDYDFTDPDRDLECHSGDPSDSAPSYDFPGGFGDPGAGKVASARWLASVRRGASAVRGNGVCMRFIPGFRFRLLQESTIATEHLITAVSHSGEQPQVLDEEATGEPASYCNSFACASPSEVFPPEYATPMPRIAGVQTAIVTGPTGEDVHTDRYARVKVQFHWDRRGKRDDKSSCWIRVSQGWAGAGWGSMVLPRVGQEVIVSFLEGDPDRPLITGYVYNGKNPVPYPLPDDKTKSTVLTRSTPDGTNGNEIRFEDRAGAEEFYVHAQRDWVIRTENDKRQVTQANETVSVGGNQTTTVSGSRAVKVEQAAAETVALAKVVAVGGAYQVAVGGVMNTTVGAAQTEEVLLSKKVIVGESLELVCGNGRLLIEKSGKITIQGTSLEFTSSGPVTINGSVIDLN